MLTDLSQEELDKLNTQLEEWKTEGVTAHAEMYPKWNKYDEYFANEQTPSGFTSDHIAKAQEANDPTVALAQAKQYVVVNKVRQTHEQVLGDFITGKKVITASGRSPKDRRLANIVKKEFQFVTDKTQLWDRVMVPTIDSCIRRGIHFIKVNHNPYRDLPNGRIDIEGVSCRDIIIDPITRDQYYEDKRFIIHRKRYRTSYANEKFKDLLEPGVEFGPDNETEEAYNTAVETNENHTTIYEFQHCKVEWRYFLQTDPQDEDSLEEISEDEFKQVSSDPKLAQYAFKQQEDAWYVSFYNTTLKTFYHELNEFGMCTIIEVINIRDESVAYPIADSEYYINLQDLFNILLSVILENAKQGNSPIVGIDPETYTTSKDAIEATLNRRGPKVIPAATMNVVQPQQLNQMVVLLLERVDGYISDMQSKHAASTGQLPSKQIAQGTVDALITQDRQAHGRKDVTIRYAMTQLARLVTRIIFRKFTEQHWAKLTDTGKNEPDYTPVNIVASQQEYDELLLMMMGVNTDIPQTNDENIATLQQLDAFKKKFEQENEVKVKKHPIFVINDEQGGELRYTERQLKEAADSLGLDVEQFTYLYSPKQVIETFYVINDITNDPEIDLIYDIDFDYERDRQVRQSQAFYAADKGWITPKRALTMTDFPDVDAATEEADKRNEILQLGEMIASNPKAMDYVRQLFATQQQGAEKK